MPLMEPVPPPHGLDEFCEVCEYGWGHFRMLTPEEELKHLQSRFDWRWGQLESIRKFLGDKLFYKLLTAAEKKYPRKVPSE